MNIRLATPDDFEKIWPIFHHVVQDATTYVYSPTTSKKEAYDIWMTKPVATYVVENASGDVLGTYYIKENRPGLGSHICRCGFMVSPDCRRQGIGRKMCEHALKHAKLLGFRGMQLGYVVSTNKASVALWLSMGFTHVGTVPKAFQHRELGDVDVLIMYQDLTREL